MKSSILKKEEAEVEVESAICLDPFNCNHHKPFEEEQEFLSIFSSYFSRFWKPLD